MSGLRRQKVLFFRNRKHRKAPLSPRGVADAVN